MQVHFHRPKSERLQPYLEGYYFLTQEADEPPVEYLTFPNNFSIVSAFYCNGFQYIEGGVILEKAHARVFSSSLICHYQKPIRVVIQGPVNEITFYFKPLGLNAFLNRELCDYTGKSFTDFVPYPDYTAAMAGALNETDEERRRDIIETYWLSKLTGFKHPFLSELVTELLNPDEETGIQELAEKYGTSRQNIHKLFGAHLGKSPAAFRKIQRFRDTLSKSIQTDENLTALSHECLFYDQSHFIRDFKALTGLAPKTFFNSISLQEGATRNWLFLA